VPPEGQVTFAFEVTAPAAPGVIPFTWGIVEEAVEWKTEDLGVGPVTILPAGAQADAGNDSAALVSADVPRRMVSGQRYRVTLVVRNTGTRAWRREHLVRLGSQEPENNLVWGPGRIDVPRDVEPGDTVPFTFDVVAPATSGEHAFSWRVVREGVAWVGPVLRAGPVTVVSRN
jgi:Ig-like domain from next to BRCA1 gene